MLEIPDRHITILLMDDGEDQEVLTTSDGYPEVWRDFLEEKGFEVRGIRHSWRGSIGEDGSYRLDSAWHKNGDELLRVGRLSGITVPTNGSVAEAGKEAHTPA